MNLGARTSVTIITALAVALTPSANLPSSAASDRLPELTYLRTAPVYAGLDLDVSNWVLTGLGVEGAASPSAGTGVTVAIVSDGLVSGHPEFSGRVAAGWDAVTRTPYLGEPESRLDAAPVGTALAGLLAAGAGNGGVTGVAPGAKLMPIRVESRWTAGDDHVGAGIDWAAGHGADLIVYAPGKSTARLAQDPVKTCRAISAARSAGVAVFVPAANDLLDPGYYAAPFNPARCDDAIVVAGFDHRLGTVFGVPNAATPDFAVPATRLVTTAGSHDGLLFVTVDGVSYAPALAAGALAALITGQNAGVEELLGRLRSTAVDIGPPGTDAIFGAGAVDLYTAAGDGAGRDAESLRSAVDRVVAPRVLQIVGLSGNRTAVSWEPPVVPVDRYVIEVHDADGSTSSNHEVGGKALRAVVPSSVPFGGWVTVGALSGGQLRVSVPVASSARFFTARTLGPSWVVTDAKAFWGRDGLRVEASGQGAVAWTVKLIDADTGRLIRTSTSTGGSRLVKFAPEDRVRAQPIVVETIVAGRGISHLVAPQYGVDGLVRIQPAGTPVVEGSAVAAIRSRSANTGDRIRVVDHRTGRYLVSTAIRPDGTFAVALPAACKGDVVVLQVSPAAGSMPLTVPSR